MVIRIKVYWDWPRPKSAAPLCSQGPREPLGREGAARLDDHDKVCWAAIELPPPRAMAAGEVCSGGPASPLWEPSDPPRAGDPTGVTHGVQNLTTGEVRRRQVAPLPLARWPVGPRAHGPSWQSGGQVARRCWVRDPGGSSAAQTAGINSYFDEIYAVN